MKMKVLGSFAAIFVLASCASAPKAPVSLTGVDKARWETKIKVKDLKTEKTQSVSLDLLGEKNGRLRMEATALMGFPVASYVLAGGEFRCAVYNQKRYYAGPASAESMRTLLKVDLSPGLFRDVAFEQEPAGWTCRKDAVGVQACTKGDLAVTWERMAGGKKVHIASPQFEIDWVFGAPKTEVQFKQDSFHLEPPQGFQIIRL